MSDRGAATGSLGSPGTPRAAAWPPRPAAPAGRSVEKIADRGGWKRGSAVLQGYIDDVDGWTDNVLAGIVL